MKKIFLVAFISLFGICEMSSQVTFTPGIRGGLNLSNITQTDGSYKPDFYIGGFGAINFTKRYTLQPEINYSRQGANDIVSQEYNANTGDYFYTKKDVSINYISLSAMNKFNIVDGFQIMVGPTLDFIVGDNLSYQYNEVDLGVNLGFGYKFPSGISIEARFKKGIADVLDGNYYYNGDNYFFDDYNTNNVFQFGVSYAFNLKGKK